MISDIVAAVVITIITLAAFAAVIFGGYGYLSTVNDWQGAIYGALGLYVIAPAFLGCVVLAAWLSGRYASQPLGGMVSMIVSASIYFAATAGVKATWPPVTASQKMDFDERSERTRQRCIDEGADASALCKEFLRRFPKR